LETVRAIILRDRLLLFDADSENLRQPITYIQQRLAFGVRNSEEAFMPFEFRALEGILIHSCISVERDFYRIEKGLLELLETLPTHSGPEYLERLRLEEQGLNYLFARIRKFQYVLQTVLDTDEDMANMYLTEKYKTPEVRKNPMDHEEAEMLLESYLQVVDDLTSRAGLLNQAIDDTENLIEINLDTKRNQLLQVTIRINTFSTVFGFGTAVTGIFGMMLPVPSVMSDLPTSQYFFYGAVAFVLFGIVLMIFVVTRWCRRLGQGLYTRRNSWLSRLRGL
jgi:magnesium transporter